MRIGPSCKRSSEKEKGLNAPRTMIETLVSKASHEPVVTGFKRPFTMERLCAAFGENLGGNSPEPAWFEGFDVMAATRRTNDVSRHSAVAALMRRRSDGALRLVASDHIKVRSEMGADFMLARTHVGVLSDTMLAASDDGMATEAVGAAIQIAVLGISGEGEGPVEILSERRQRDDLKDVRARRSIRPAIDALRRELSGLSSADRRAATLRMLESIEAQVG